MAIVLLEWVLTSVFLILVVLALRASLGKRISAGMRYALWAVVLLRLLVPVQLFTSPIAGTWVFSQTRVEQDAADFPPVIDPSMSTSFPVDVVGQPVKDTGLGNALTLSPPDAPEAPAAPIAPDLSKAPAWLGWLWLAGSGVAALVLLLSNLSFWRRLRRVRIPMGETAGSLRTYRAEGLPSPCLFGLPRPAVYITPEAAADPAMLRHVQAHELTHCRHGDHIWSLLRCAALAIHWWNPLVWVATVLSQMDGELACDEGALKRLGDGERAGYGNTLLSLVTAKPGPVDLFRCATTMTGDKKTLKERVTRIAQAPKHWLWAAVAAVLVTALACVCAFGQAAEEPGDGPGDFVPVWPYGVSEMTYVRDAGGFYGDFTITLRYDGSFTYYEGLASSYIGMGTWGLNGDVVRFADEGLKDSAGIQYYYFKVVDGGLAFQAANSAKFMYVDVADGDRFSRKDSAPKPTASSELEGNNVLDVAPDLNRNGVPEELRVMSADGGMGEELEVWEGNELIFSEEGYFAHIGYNSLFLCALDGEDYLLRYHPTMYQGYCTYNYQLFTLEDGREAVARENSVGFDICFAPLMHESFEPEAIAAFMDEINGLLNRSVQLINTDDYLLDTFQEEDRLYDSLWWLDHFEETYTRDPSKSLLENLRAFQEAMEKQYVAETPQVRSIDEHGTHMILTYQGRQTQFDGLWAEAFQPADQVHPQVLDLNRDGKDEIAFILVEGHGTGAMEQRLYIFDADTLKQYDTADLTKRLIQQITSTGDDQYFYLSAPGMEQVAIPKDVAGVGPTPDAIELGNVVEYSLKDGALCCYLGCDASGRTLEYCGEIQIILTMNRQGSVSATSFAYVPYEQYEAGSPMEQAHKQYRDVLLCVKPFTYTESGQASRGIYVSDIPELFPLGDDGYTAVDKFSQTDLDGDGIPEVVMQVIAVAGDAGGYIVLDQRDNAVYGLKTSYRTFCDLKKDGTFTYSDPTGSETGTAALHTVTGQLTKCFYCVLDHETDRYSYYINGKEASHEEYEAVQAEQDGKPNVIWYAFNSANVRAVFP